MSMITKKRKSKNKLKRNVTKSAYTQYLLKKNGYKQTDIATELGISFQAVSRAILGLSKISRVDEWLETNLNLEAEKANKVI